MIPLREAAGGVSFSIKVHPRARRNAITGTAGEALKVSLTAPPVDGKANQAVVEFFAALFEIPRSSVTIASGESSRQKAVRVAGVNRQTVERRLMQVLESQTHSS
jgi:uncharacterized protein (TIGR00251 family)